MRQTRAMTTTRARFEITMTPDPAGDLDGAAGRFTFAKTWTGSMEGTGRGVMLSAGDPGTGSAGYVAIEVFEGTIDGHEGSVSFQQFGVMDDGTQRLDYALVPGSGTGDLAGIRGTVELTVVDGVHDVALSYDLP